MQNSPGSWNRRVALAAFAVALCTTGCFDSLISSETLAPPGQIPDRIFVTSQEDLDHLAGLTEVGELHVYNVHDLSPLKQLRRVRSAFELRGCQVTDLSALSSLTEVGGAFTLSGLDRIRDLRGLENLRSLGPYRDRGVVSILGCDELTSLDGLGTLGVMRLTIEANRALRSIAALERTTFTDSGRIVIRQNPELRTLEGLRVPTSLEDLHLTGNPVAQDFVCANLQHIDYLVLRTLSGGAVSFPHLRRVDNTLFLHLEEGETVHFPALEQCRRLISRGDVPDGSFSRTVALRGLRLSGPSVRHVGQFRLDGLESLDLLYPDSKVSLPRSDSVQTIGMVSLTGLDGVTSLASLRLRVTDALEIAECSDLRALEVELDGDLAYLRLSDNSSLTDVSSLDGVDLIDRVHFTDNDLVCTSALEALADRVQATHRTIEDNAECRVIR